MKTELANINQRSVKLDKNTGQDNKLLCKIINRYKSKIEGKILTNNPLNMPKNPLKVQKQSINNQKPSNFMETRKKLSEFILSSQNSKQKNSENNAAPPMSPKNIVLPNCLYFSQKKK